MSEQNTKPETTAAATDVAEFMTDLDGGQFDRMLSAALSRTAAAVVDHEKKGKVTVTFDIEHIPGTQQVRIGHVVKFLRPTMTGKAGEESEGASVLYVGKFGALSLAQPSLFGREERERQRNLPNT